MIFVQCDQGSIPWDLWLIFWMAMIFESHVHQFQLGFLFAFHIPLVIIGQINALALLQNKSTCRYR